jgi:hypothetical protein
MVVWERGKLSSRQTAQSCLVHPSQVPWQPTKAQLSRVHWVFPALWGQSLGAVFVGLGYGSGL